MLQRLRCQKVVYEVFQVHLIGILQMIWGGVIRCIEVDFTDFLLETNILYCNNSHEFRDVKYGFRFIHEIKYNFYDEFLDIKKKYIRRIEQFKLETFKGVCFIRAVKDLQELLYITKNQEYINSVIKKNNCNNEIIFLIPKYLKIPMDFNSRYYILNINIYQGNYREGLRGLFDTVTSDFIEYCFNHFSKLSYKDNVIFDLQSEIKYLQKNHSFITEQQVLKDVDNAFEVVHINEAKFKCLLLLLNTNISQIMLPDRIDIYGAGEVGKAFFEKIKHYTSVGCFIDKASLENYYKEIPIVRLAEYKWSEDSYIIIIPTYAYNSICYELSEKCNVNPKKIKTLEELFNLE